MCFADSLQPTVPSPPSVALVSSAPASRNEAIHLHSASFASSNPDSSTDISGRKPKAKRERIHFPRCVFLSRDFAAQI
jgi:hypothetical protein